MAEKLPDFRSLDAFALRQMVEASWHYIAPDSTLIPRLALAELESRAGGDDAERWRTIRSALYLSFPFGKAALELKRGEFRGNKTGATVEKVIDAARNKRAQPNTQRSPSEESQ